MNLPSKELLSAVFGLTVTKTMIIDDNILYYEWSHLSNDTNGTDINIYELAHKCKEWAITNGFSVISTNSYMGDLQPMAQPVSSNGCEYPWVDGETEQEAIFKACQWILDNKEQK